ncbi:MAG: DUF4422 domain-containing protein [Paracoccaceae bacterium]
MSASPVRAAIYTAYHAPAPILTGGPIVPIHVGRATARAPLPGMIGDDTGDAISDRNASYCELTALWWAWKNDRDATHLGLMHYRRVFDMENAHPQRVETKVDRLDVDAYAAGLKTWLEANRDVDIVVSRPHVMGRTMAGNYARGHDPQDWDIAREVVAERHPGDLAVFDAVSARHQVRLGNMIVMRRDLADAYCAWLFDILDGVAGWEADRTRYSVQQSRYLGYVAERLLTVWVEKMRAEAPDLRIHEAGILNLSRALVCPWLRGDQGNDPRDVNVAFSADRAYLPHAAAMLHSMLTRADRDRRLNLYFLHGGIEAQDRALLREVLGVHPDVHLHEIDAGQTFDGHYRSTSRAPSNATYNRFLLFDLLPDLNRLLYVDVDMIWRADVAALFDTDMDGAPLGAVTDHIMTRTLTGPTPTIDRDVPDLGTYQRQVLGLSDAQIARYFNAGLLLFDLSAMDVPATGRALMEAARTGRYLFRDQDVLNAHFAGRAHALDARWNVLNTVVEGYSKVPRDNHAEAMAARRDAWVIHYAAGDYKPWAGVPVPMAAPYWQALIETPFYAEVCAGLETAAAARAASRGVIVRSGLAVAERFPALRPALMRGYARVRGR